MHHRQRVASIGLSRACVEAVRRLWPWVPLGIAGVYAVLLLTTLDGIVQGLYRSTDIALAPVIAELSDEAPAGSKVVLANFPWYEAYWFETLTRWLPGHRTLWELAPYAFSLAGVACVAWSASRAAGRWAGAMVAVALGCASAGLLGRQFAWSIHAAVLFHAPLLGAYLVLCASRGGLLGSRPVHLAAAAGVTSFTALGVASDRLLIVAGIAPLAVAGLALASIVPGPSGRRLALTACGVAVGSVLLALPITTAAQDAGLRTADFPIELATVDRLGPNMGVLLDSLAYLAGGDLGRAAPTGLVPRLFFLVLLSIGAGWTVQYVTRLRRRGPRSPMLATHVLFWASAGTITALTFVTTDLPIDRFSSRYVIITYYALAAVLVVAVAGTEGWRRAVVVAGVALVALSGVASLEREDIQLAASGRPGDLESAALADLVREEHLSHGYAGYWNAAPLTWNSEARARVYPITGCAPNAPEKAAFCRHPTYGIDSWYEPDPQARTFLVVGGTPADVPAPDPHFGFPERAVRLGQLEVQVYGHDIAARLSP
jgi:hypothetical protein